MSGLPDDIIENILKRLPVKSISRIRCVSKTWCRIFRNPNFIQNHLNYAIQMNKFNILVTNFVDELTPAESYLYSVDNNVLSSSTSSSSSQFLGHALKIDYPFMYQTMPQKMPQILGSCNGLVCIRPFSGCICIWNPATREYKQLPHAPVRYPSDNGKRKIYRYGFGFDCKNDDYKVLRIVSFPGSEVSEARVYSLRSRLYSLRSNSWKELGFIPYDFSETLTEGFLLKGVLYWVATVWHVGIKSSVTVCYDISDETFRDVPLPNSIEDPFMLDFGIWEEKLCLFHMNHMEDRYICTHQNDHVDVWTMVDNKWCKHLKITAHMTDMYFGRPIQTLPNGEILFEGFAEEERGVGLISFDSKLERARALKIHGFPDESGVDTYIETLVALNSGTYVGETKRVTKR